MNVEVIKSDELSGCTPLLFSWMKNFPLTKKRVCHYVQIEPSRNGVLRRDSVTSYSSLLNILSKERILHYVIILVERKTIALSRRLCLI